MLPLSRAHIPQFRMEGALQVLWCILGAKEEAEERSQAWLRQPQLFWQTPVQNPRREGSERVPGCCPRAIAGSREQSCRCQTRLVVSDGV